MDAVEHVMKNAFRKQQQWLCSQLAPYAKRGADHGICASGIPWKAWPQLQSSALPAVSNTPSREKVQGAALGFAGPMLKALGPFGSREPLLSES